MLIILVVLIVVCVSLFASVIWIKMAQAHRERGRSIAMKNIRPILKKLFTAGTVDFFKNHEQGTSKLADKMDGKYFRQTLEDILLDILEVAGGETKVRARTIAYQFGFPERCLSMIRDRLTGNIAIGCRKAGLYQYEEAIPDILNVLGIISSNTQHQALMALSRMGNADALVQAFDKISPLILVNERAVSEIINTFSGDRRELYKKMIHHQSDYLVRLFLKAIDPETANALIKDIVSIYKDGGKETRLAGIIAIGRSGNSGRIPILIRALTDTEWEIRAMAAKTLGVLTSPHAVKPLAKAARDGEWWVRQNAVTSILAYSDSDEILTSIVKSGDRYAYDSMLYALEKANETKLLSRIREVRPEEIQGAKLVKSLA